MKVHLGTVGFDLQWTARLPPDAQEALEAMMKRKGKPADDASFGLTPSWGDVPFLKVKNLQRAGIAVPKHWAPTNVVYPLIHNMAFYIEPGLPPGWAASYSMKGVNIRTGKREEDQLTDDPCQSYWSQAAPWIDGYVPSVAEAVRQFVPLRGEKEMAADVSDAVGIEADHPWKDGISVAFYLPTDLDKLEEQGYHGRGGYYGEGLEMAKSVTLGVRGGDRVRRSMDEGPEEVGMGAGAKMRQQHPDNPAVTKTDFLESPLLRLTARLVWDDQWNLWARDSGEQLIAASKLAELERRQREYEAYIWKLVGGKTRRTDVDALPKIK